MQCTESRNHQKFVTRHIWQEYLEEANHLRHHEDVKPIYAKRTETIERVFADGKEKHGMRWTTLRRLKKLSMLAMLTFAAMNLKKTCQLDMASPKNSINNNLGDVCDNEKSLHIEEKAKGGSE